MKRRRLTPAERREIYDKCGGHCAYCGQKISLKEMQADHVVSLRRGGADATDNMLPSCRSCNHYKGTRTLDGFRELIEAQCRTLDRDSVTYRIAVRYGNVIPNPHPIKFYFEMKGISNGTRKD